MIRAMDMPRYFPSVDVESESLSQAPLKLLNFHNYYSLFKTN